MIGNNRQEINTLTIKDLLSTDLYRIPIYQRNYDWSEKEALQLVEDIADYASTNRNRKYYIGSLVVFDKLDQQGNMYHETIDGQQRLTTLTVLLCALKNLKTKNWDSSLLDWFVRPNLSYDHRSESDCVLVQLINGCVIETDYSASMTEVYQILQKNVASIVESKGLFLRDFCEYLLNDVIILRVPVPVDTQLNHYFEIMNSRGEQLEKHEVLKANLMSLIDVSYHNLFRDLWEACSDMDSYVQMRMKSKLRSLLFSNNWEELRYDNFDDMYSQYRHLDDDNDDEDTEDAPVSRSIAELISDAKANRHYDLPTDEDGNKNPNERFGSIVNFPNFLLHVLKVYYHSYQNNKDDVEKEIMLDDKRLIDTFLKVIKSIDDSQEQSNFVKGYMVELLRVRTLFDKYVIKRENYNNREGWSLKRLKLYSKSKVNYVATFNGDQEDDNDDNKEIRMLQAMFHVSAPTQIYKYWLYAVLNYICSKKQLNTLDFKVHLIGLAKSYILDRYLNEDEEKKQYFKSKFFEVIYNNNYQPIKKTTSIVWGNLNQGCGVENYIFNFYDFILWKHDKTKYPTFEFTYRTSVEHFYPQHPGNDYPNLKDKGLDDFGNLCLISRGMNSKFSNNMPLAKLANFGNENEVELSLKLQEMMEEVRSSQVWDERTISKYTESAKDRIEEFLRGSDNV